jgi:hypothetical protein
MLTGDLGRTLRGASWRSSEQNATPTRALREDQVRLLCGPSALRKWTTPSKGEVVVTPEGAAAVLPSLGVISGQGPRHCGVTRVAWCTSSVSQAPGSQGPSSLIDPCSTTRAAAVAELYHRRSYSAVADGSESRRSAVCLPAWRHSSAWLCSPMPRVEGEGTC